MGQVLWGISSGAQRSGSHTGPSPAEQDTPIPRLHQRLPLGDEDGEDLGALKLEQQCHTGDMPGCLVAPGQVGAKVWEAAQKHKLGMAEQRE